MDNSLRRLGVDHVDLCQIHRWDPRTSDEETRTALTDLQRAGKIRYFGSSTFPAYRVVQAQWAARDYHLSRYVTEQPNYSILQWLTGAIREGQEITTSRSTFMPQRFDTTMPANRAKLDAIEQLTKVADEAGLTMIQLALGFVTAHPAVTSALIGPAHRSTCTPNSPPPTPRFPPTCSTRSSAPGTDLAAHEKNDTPPALLDPALRRR